LGGNQGRIDLWRYANLIAQLTRREVAGRYRGSMLGLLWYFVHPILLLSVYLFVFGFVFQVKWGVELDTGEAEFGVVLFAGLIIHFLFSECMTRSTAIITSNIQLVKKVIFPLEILPVVVVCTAVIHLLIGLAILLVFNSVAHQTFHWTTFYVPVVLAPLVILSLGIGWILASVSVFIRDIAQVVGVGTTALLFLSAIFYPIEMIPEHLRSFLYLSPLTLIVEQLRVVVIYGQSPDWGALLVYTAVALAVAVLGYRWFQMAKSAFADVL